MKKERIKQLLQLYAWPAALIILGLVLVFSPDTASALIAKILGWGIIVVGACTLIAAIAGAPYERMRKIAFAVLCLGVGIFIVAFPLVLAEALGRFFGLFLIIQGVGNIQKALQKKKADLPYQFSLGIAILTLLAGIVLALLPLTLSRVILNICGIVIVVIGIANIIGRYQEQKLLEAGKNSNIIDAQ